MNRRILVIGLAIILGALMMVNAEGIAKEKILVIGDGSPVTTLDPAASLISQNIMMARNLFQGLMRFVFNSVELEGDLAKSWTVSKDGLVYTFKLRDNINFHKGFGKVTAHDVKFSFDRVMDPETRSPMRSELASVNEVKVIDELTVEISLKERDAVFLQKCARPRPLAIVSKKGVEKYGKDFARNPIGSGPFVFQSMSREQIVLTANQEYWEGPAKVDKVIFKTIPDLDTLTMVMERGDIHTVQGYPREKGVLDRVKAAGCEIKPLNRGAWHHMKLNPDFKPFADVRVRRAIAHAIDRDQIIQHVLSGTAQKLDSLVPKGFFGHTEESLRRYEYDPKKAKELLAEAGYPNGFEVTHDTFTHPSYLHVATAIQGQLEKVGIKTKLVVTDQPTWMKKVTSATTHMTLYLPVRIPDADIPLSQFYHSAGFPPGPNVMRYNKLDREIDEARRELDPNKRKELYHAIQKRLMEDLPAIPLFMMQYPTPYRPDVITGIPDMDPVWGFDFYPIRFVEKK